MTREDALDSIYENVENENLIKHMLSTEAIMEALAKKLGEDTEEWGLAGLVHDIDVELTEGDMNSHGRLGADLIREMGESEELVHAILAHNEILGVPRETKLDKALFCTDPLTGLITAAALVRPDRVVELNAEAAVDVDRPVVTLPGHAKHDYTVGLDNPLEDLRIHVLGVPFETGNERFDHFLDSLVEFRLGLVLRLDGFQEFSCIVLQR